VETTSEVWVWGIKEGLPPKDEFSQNPALPGRGCKAHLILPQMLQVIFRGEKGNETIPPNPHEVIPK